MATVSEYEKLRQKNIADNKRILAELGLLNPFEPLPRVIKKAPKRKRQPDVPKPEKRFIPEVKFEPESLEEYGSQMDGKRRRSSRLTGQAPLSQSEIEEDTKKWREEEFDGEDEDGTPRRKNVLKRPMAYGAIPGVEVGTLWPMRIDCNAAGIHRPTVAGIHGGPQGAYSIVLSGGYEDNIDLGTCFTYTGEGGRDLKGTVSKPKNLRTAPQSKDQCLSRGNAGLVKSTETGFPVRVVRGFKLTSPFAPEEGYRYDGLYNVEKWWYTTGVAGYRVYKFALKRRQGQAPPPWSLEGVEDALPEGGTQDSGVGSGPGSEGGSECEDDTMEQQTEETAEERKPDSDESSHSNMENEFSGKEEKTGDKHADLKTDNKPSLNVDEKSDKIKMEASMCEAGEEINNKQEEVREGSEEKQEADSGDDEKETKEQGKDDSEMGGARESSEEGKGGASEMGGAGEGNDKGCSEMAGGSIKGTSEELVVNGEDSNVAGIGKNSLAGGIGETSDVGGGDRDKSEHGGSGVSSPKVTEGEGDKENTEGGQGTPGSAQRKKNVRRLSGKGSKQSEQGQAQKNTMLKYFNKA